jgi:hypothetical protein
MDRYAFCIVNNVGGISAIRRSVAALQLEIVGPGRLETCPTGPALRETGEGRKVKRETGRPSGMLLDVSWHHKLEGLPEC